MGQEPVSQQLSRHIYCVVFFVCYLRLNLQEMDLRHPKTASGICRNAEIGDIPKPQFQATNVYRRVIGIKSPATLEPWNLKEMLIQILLSFFLCPLCSNPAKLFLYFPSSGVIFGLQTVWGSDCSLHRMAQALVWSRTPASRWPRPLSWRWDGGLTSCRTRLESGTSSKHHEMSSSNFHPKFYHPKNIPKPETVWILFDTRKTSAWLIEAAHRVIVPKCKAVG